MINVPPLKFISFIMQLLAAKFALFGGNETLIPGVLVITYSAQTTLLLGFSFQFPIFFRPLCPAQSRRVQGIGTDVLSLLVRTSLCPKKYWLQTRRWRSFLKRVTNLVLPMTVSWMEKRSGRLLKPCFQPSRWTRPGRCCRTQRPLFIQFPQQRRKSRRMNKHVLGPARKD